MTSDQYTDDQNDNEVEKYFKDAPKVSRVSDELRRLLRDRDNNLSMRHLNNHEIGRLLCVNAPAILELMDVAENLINSNTTGVSYPELEQALAKLNGV